MVSRHVECVCLLKEIRLSDLGKISHKQAIEKAKNVPCIFNNWANFYKGEFISNTILNANSFEKLLK